MPVKDLLERFEGPLVETVETIGAMQGQAWGALPVGLWSRMSLVCPRRPIWSFGARRAAVGHRHQGHFAPRQRARAPCLRGGRGRADGRLASGTIGETTAGDGRAARAGVLSFAKRQPRTNEEIRQYAEDWVARHPGEIEKREVEAQRSLKWRPIYRWSALVRVPAGSAWGAKTPSGPSGGADPAGQARSARDASRRSKHVAIAHLRAFGPAAAEDVACWTGCLACLTGAWLCSKAWASSWSPFEDEAGRTLYDLPGASAAGPGDISAGRACWVRFDSSLACLCR